MSLHLNVRRGSKPEPFQARDDGPLKTVVLEGRTFQVVDQVQVEVAGFFWNKIRCFHFTWAAVVAQR